MVKIKYSYMKIRTLLKLVAVFVIIIVIIVVNRNSPSDEDVYKSAYESVKFTKYEGKISKKFFFKNSQNYPSILVKNKLGTQKIMFIYDKSGLYEYLQVGDSIYKEYGKYDVFIIRDSVKKKFTLDYCIKP